MPRFWLTYCDPARRLLGVVILDSPSLLEARLQALIDGTDRNAELCEGHELDDKSAGRRDRPDVEPQGGEQGHSADRARDSEKGCSNISQAPRFCPHQDEALVLRRGEADMDGHTKLAGSVENDTQETSRPRASMLSVRRQVPHECPPHPAAPICFAPQ